MAKYVVTLNGKNYEVEVEKNTAKITNTTAAAAPAAAPAPKAAPAPAPVAAPAPAPVAAAPAGGANVTAPMKLQNHSSGTNSGRPEICLLYTSDAADEL